MVEDLAIFYEKYHVKLKYEWYLACKDFIHLKLAKSFNSKEEFINVLFEQFIYSDMKHSCERSLHMLLPASLLHYSKPLDKCKSNASVSSISFALKEDVVLQVLDSLDISKSVQSQIDELEEKENAGTTDNRRIFDTGEEDEVQKNEVLSYGHDKSSNDGSNKVKNNSPGPAKRCLKIWFSDGADMLEAIEVSHIEGLVCPLTPGLKVEALLILPSHVNNNIFVVLGAFAERYTNL